jgi:hypothetical protein
VEKTGGARREGEGGSWSWRRRAREDSGVVSEKGSMASRQRRDEEDTVVFYLWTRCYFLNIPR